MRWWALLLLIACDSATPTERVPTPEPVEPREAVVESEPEALEVAEPEASIEELAVAVPDRNTLPKVLSWLPDARRCDRHGRRRFCNGPRKVPEPLGVAAELARTLGLGTHRAAAEMIRTEPRPEWLAALEEHGVAPPRYPLHWPVDGGRFGRGVTFRGRRVGGHRGIDVTAEVGTEVRAVADAMVGYSDNTIRGYGNLLVLLHGGGEVSAYAHLSAVHVYPGQVVRRGQIVALAGNTGISRGPHLHMEWREGGELADPMPRFPSENVPAWMRERLASR